MPIRKNRVPLQGVSNFKMNSHTNVSQGKSTATYRLFDHKHNQNVDPAANEAILNIKTDLVKRQSQAMGSPAADLLAKVRRNYKSKNHVQRILRGWDFDRSKTISKQQFASNLSSVLKMPVADQEIDTLMNHFGKGKQYLTAPAFLELIYQHSESYVGKTIDRLEAGGIARQQSEGILYRKSEMQHPAQNTKQVEMSGNLSTEPLRAVRTLSQSDSIGLSNQQATDNQSSCPGIRQAGKKTNSEAQFQKTDIMFFPRSKLNNFKNVKIYRKLKQTNKQQTCDPNSMLGINQRKTRFGATPSPSRLLLGSSQCLYNCKTVDVLAQQRNVNKTRREKRLLRIRENQLHESECAKSLDCWQQNRDQANLARIKMQKQLNEYNAYIKNKWQ